MKKTLLLGVFSVLSISFGYSQTEKAWKSFDGKEVKIAKTAERGTFPASYKLMQLELASLKNTLVTAPNRFGSDVSNVIISIPNVDGKLERFQMYEASNFDAELQAMYPEIRSYVGIGLDDKYAQLRLSLDPRGIQTMVFRVGKSNEFMEPYSQDGKVYAVYASKSDRKGKLPFTCSTDDQELISSIESKTNFTSRSSTTSLLNFRLAISCTGEYSNYFGATSAAQSGLVLAAYNATMTRVNGVYEKDFAIHMNIVAQTTNVIYYNPATDPYSDAATGATGAWNAEVQNALSSSLTGPSTSLAANNAAYDIGHLFGGSGGGGNAGCIGCVCVNDTASTSDKNKGSAFTSPGDGVPAGDTFDIDYVAHEMGHQFGGNHTFTHTTENNSVNYEPGSGSTIMAYAGITNFDVQPNSDDYFHAGSIAQVQANMATKTCQTTVAITHGAPVVNAGSDWIIPISTPFMLTGSATDAGGTSSMSYCWEQYNDAATGAELCSVTVANPAGDTDCTPSATKTLGANFRSYDPTVSPSRRFPKIESTLANSLFTQGAEIPVEFLSSVARTLNFRLTARDNVAAGGQTNFDDMIVTVSAAAGPFDVTSQNTDGIVWTPGNTETITWSVNNTTALVGSANVDILLSTDGGFTYPTVLLANTPNDGTQVITVPSVTAANCRVMVKPTGNIYYDINTKNIAIGNYTYQAQNVCSDYVINFGGLAIPENSGSFVGYGVPVPESFTLTDSNYKVELTHGDIGSVFLAVRPAHIATGVTQFFNGSCDGTANMNLNFDTSGTALNCAASTSGANTIPPVAASVGAINAYNGNSATGTWYLFFTDIAVGDGITGTIEKVTFNLCRAELVPVLSSESFGINDLVLYPNPNNGIFNIQFTSTTGNEIKVNVHDLRGRAIFNKSYTNNGLFNESLELSNVQSGIYMVTIEDGANKEVKKIIIE
jgi:hypothetical protein